MTVSGEMILFVTVEKWTLSFTYFSYKRICDATIDFDTKNSTKESIEFMIQFFTCYYIANSISCASYNRPYCTKLAMRSLAKHVRRSIAGFGVQCH